MKVKKNVALVAHDNRKRELNEWVEWNFETLLNHKLICTGTTGLLVEKVMEKNIIKIDRNPKTFSVKRLKSGPLGGDQQLGSMIAEGKIDVLIFLWDPMEPQPHDVDVKALLRIAAVYNIPTACNRSTADFIISSPIMKEKYEPKLKDYGEYLNRSIV